MQIKAIKEEGIIKLSLSTSYGPTPKHLLKETIVRLSTDLRAIAIDENVQTAFMDLVHFCSQYIDVNELLVNSKFAKARLLNYSFGHPLDEDEYFKKLGSILNPDEEDGLGAYLLEQMNFYDHSSDDSASEDGQVEVDPFNIINPFEIEEQSKKIINFILPKNPLLAIQLISCLDAYSLLNTGEENATNVLAELLEFKHEVEYSSTMSILEKTFESFKNNDKKEFLKFIFDEHCNILWEKTSQLLLNPDITPKMKDAALLTTTKELIKSGQTKELNQMLYSINILAKKNLFTQCLGKPAFDQKPDGFNWRYTEWEFLEHAHFIIREDGLLSISELDQNIAYLNFYAPGKAGNEVFEKEMTYLFNALGLEMKSCNHQELIFTAESSKLLITQGLHINKKYTQGLLHTQNNSSRFFRCMPFEMSDKIDHYSLATNEQDVEESTKLGL